MYNCSIPRFKPLSLSGLNPSSAASSSNFHDNNNDNDDNNNNINTAIMISTASF